MEDRYVKVLGKGSKERLVAFGAACQRSLVNYYMHFRVEPAHHRIVEFFLSIDGYPLSPAGVKSFMVRLGRSAGGSKAPSSPLAAHVCNIVPDKWWGCIPAQAESRPQYSLNGGELCAHREQDRSDQKSVLFSAGSIKHSGR